MTYIQTQLELPMAVSRYEFTTEEEALSYVPKYEDYDFFSLFVDAAQKLEVEESKLLRGWSVLKTEMDTYIIPISPSNVNKKIETVRNQLALG